MLRYLLQEHAITSVPIFVLLLFLTLVALITAWVYRPGATGTYRAIAKSVVSNTNSNTRVKDGK